MIPKFFIGPMSKNIVDTVIDFCNETNNIIGIIPSRRQIEFDGGYVNNWTTSEFIQYIRNKTNKVLLVRDHSGPSQGKMDDDGYESLKEDCKFFDVIHIDPWKKYQDLNEGTNETIKMIEFCYESNPNIFYEVGTEESIRKFTPKELDVFVQNLKSNLHPSKFEMIKFLVIQSGTSLKETNQTGKYDKERLSKMIEVCKKHKLFSKEHNGDYLPTELIKEKFNYGLDSINIAPEFGVIETEVILEEIEKLSNKELFNQFYEICLSSKKWVKWVNEDFDFKNKKRELILICGHYVFSDYNFVGLKNKLNIDIDKKINSTLNNKLNLML